MSGPRSQARSASIGVYQRRRQPPWRVPRTAPRARGGDDRYREARARLFRPLYEVGVPRQCASSLALLRAAYQDTAERARAVGAWGGVGGIAAASGPIVGGVLVSIADWRSDAGLDPPGQVLGVLTLTLLTLGLIEGGS